ncbi:MAG TPA: mechanosensitive ion channel [Epsilonproteobacteria bacterium]|nr:mechanosensitive ion channel [Campylobacterota bacterium]HHH37660.1 mechanosensitive ion channel [Campylobacterota bacterium]
MAVVLFLFFWISAVAIKRLLSRVSTGVSAEKKNVLRVLGQIVYVSMVVIGSLTALGTLGVDVSAIITGLGLTGFAVGFALKDILSNLLAGALLILYNTFSVDDVIRVSGFEGRVEEINLRFTIIVKDDERIYIPNATMFSNAITVKS